MLLLSFPLKGREKGTRFPLSLSPLSPSNSPSPFSCSSPPSRRRRRRRPRLPRRLPPPRAAGPLLHQLPLLAQAVPPEPHAEVRHIGLLDVVALGAREPVPRRDPVLLDLVREARVEHAVAGDFAEVGSFFFYFGVFRFFVLGGGRGKSGELGGREKEKEEKKTPEKAPP